MVIEIDIYKIRGDEYFLVYLEQNLSNSNTTGKYRCGHLAVSSVYSVQPVKKLPIQIKDLLKLEDLVRKSQCVLFVKLYSDSFFRLAA